MRWQHPVRGLLYPDQFIPLAEKIRPDRADRRVGAERGLPPDGGVARAGHRDGTWRSTCRRCSSAIPGLIQLVRETLDRYALEPGCLTLEVTESTAMRDPTRARPFSKRSNDMGVKISIDDFGTGYSSLLYLKRLPATELKIDRGFVRDLAPHTEDAAIVSAIVALGRTLNLSIVAEGIETRRAAGFPDRNWLQLSAGISAGAADAGAGAGGGAARGGREEARKAAGQQVRWVPGELAGIAGCAAVAVRGRFPRTAGQTKALRVLASPAVCFRAARLDEHLFPPLK